MFESLIEFSEDELTTLREARAEGRLIIIPKTERNKAYTVEWDPTSCRLYINEHDIECYELLYMHGEGWKLSGPGASTWDGIQEFFGADDKQYSCRIDAENARRAMMNDPIYQRRYRLGNA